MGDKKGLDDTNAELCAEGEGGENEERQIEVASKTPVKLQEGSIKCSDIFKDGHLRRMRTVLTKGVAGVGKTCTVLRFIMDWGKGNANQDIHFLFPLLFWQLNPLKGKMYKLVDLVHECIPEAKDIKKDELDEIFTKLQRSGNSNYENSECKILFILDGLDECRLELDYSDDTEICGDITEPTSVDELLSNLIKGCLLPAARLWITSRPAAADKIPSKCVDMTTEVRGLNQAHRENYFKKMNDEKTASRIISYIKTSKTLYIMCQVPVLECISATVLKQMLSTEKQEEISDTLREMYANFLVLQTKQKNTKLEKPETDPHWDKESIKSILSLGKLAFQQLEKGTLVFYEADLRECDIDLHDASVYAALFTQSSRAERVIYQEKVYSFVNLSIQEFLAAVFVFLSFIINNENLMAEPQSTSNKMLALFRDKPEVRFFKNAVNKALEKSDGHFDIFLRFLLGLSLESNQLLIEGLLRQKRNGSHRHHKAIKSTSQGSINLQHVLNELSDHTLVEDIQDYLTQGGLSTDIPGTGWAALGLVLMSPAEEREETCSRSEEDLQKLLPVMKANKAALLSRFRPVPASALLSDPRKPDRSENDLQDSGVKLPSAGPGSPHCKPETPRPSDSEEGCVSLASAMRSKPSHPRALDLEQSYNPPGDSEAKRPSGLDDRTWELGKINVIHVGEFEVKPGLRKCACDLTMDPETASQILALSEDKRRVAWGGEEHEYPDEQPERFEYRPQVLCREGLSGRCYWEVERSEGGVCIGVTYKGINRAGENGDSLLGYNDKSWALISDGNAYTAWHNKRRDVLSSCSSSRRVGVYLDWPAGSLSFYTVVSDTLTHLFTFNTTFTEPLYPAFGLWFENSSVTLCQVE